ncbi:unnamed protein product [Kuraishia capsulata CBS 1993]|uniref:Uncharacterized protein n=1 Tax=Kuraishia capsulata CBS 1993 TaxID=1382522 RepID=W6MGC1_9ASCO|nr:uncharacterized protein KUCA_T00000482001 [Kuraishia capsulata CBS 1993]CDK24518.1 unnamed protein product [Kuraishia capsulata CBS 1993]
MSAANPQIDDFLSRVKELDIDRVREDTLRRQKLEQDIALKKKKLGDQGLKKVPFVPAKSVHLAKLNISHTNTAPKSDIQLINLRAREDGDENNREAFEQPVQRFEKTVKDPVVSSKSGSNGPQPVKLEDVLNEPKRTDIRFNKSYTPIHHPEKEIPKRNTPITTPSSKESSQSTSSFTPHKPSLPTRTLNSTYIPLPNSIAAISATAAAKAPALMRTSDDPDISSTAKVSSSSNYIPMPSSIAAMSATAAAKAPALMRTTDKSVGERARGLDYTAKFFAQPGEKPGEVPSVSHTSHVPASSITSAKARPIVPKKPEIDIRAKSPAIAHKAFTKSSAEIPEALKAAAKLRSPSPILKKETQQPEALNRLQNLNRSSPIRKASEEVPEALRSKLRPAVPVKKPDLVLPDAVAKANSIMKKSTGSYEPVKRNDFEKNNETLLKNSLAGLRRSQTTQPDLPERKPPVSASTFPASFPHMVRLPFMDPNAAPPIIHNTAAPTQRVISKTDAPQKLNHVTKARSKGPKRRLPANISNDSTSSSTSTARRPVTPVPSIPVKVIVKPKKIPPPIRSSSRKVSTSEVFI